MNVKTYSSLRILCLLLTFVLFIGHIYAPQKKLIVHPSPNASKEIYAYTHPITGRSGDWINENTNEWFCNYLEENRFGCGFSMYWDGDFVRGMDLSSYDGLNISLNYQGEASRVRINLRQFNPEYSTPKDGRSTKFMSMTIRTKELNQGKTFIKFSEFSVAEWWLKERNIRRIWSAPEFNNIVAIGVDHVERGIHKIQIEEIELVGRWIKTETLLLFTVIFWMSVFLFEGIFRFYLLYRKAQSDKQAIDHLKHNQHNLEDEREKIRLLSSTDPLTGISNRAGMTEKIKHLFVDTSAIPEPYGIMLFDIDYFKNINDTHGHDIGDKILRTFSQIMTSALREDDIFARWGGEEFILICQKKSLESFLNIAEKLREMVANHVFDRSIDLNITISVGTTSILKGDTFELAFKRADNALYKAKHNGRNRVEYED